MPNLWFLIQMLFYIFISLFICNLKKSSSYIITKSSHLHHLRGSQDLEVESDCVGWKVKEPLKRKKVIFYINLVKLYQSMQAKLNVPQFKFQTVLCNQFEKRFLENWINWTHCGWRSCTCNRVSRTCLRISRARWIPRASGVWCSRILTNAFKANWSTWGLIIWWGVTHFQILKNRGMRVIYEI